MAINPSEPDTLAINTQHRNNKELTINNTQYKNKLVPTSLQVVSRQHDITLHVVKYYTSANSLTIDQYDHLH